MSEVNKLENRNDLAKALNIKLSSLTHILYIKKIENMYHTFEIPKKK